jgi:hypothetical protein
MSERIQPENNRTFTTGSGDWTGGLVWHGDTLQGKQGYITCQVDEDNPTKTIILIYPAIQPAPNKNHRFKMSLCLPEFSSNPPHLDWHIIDGAGFSYGEVGIYPHATEWALTNITFPFPADFNVPGTQLVIEVYALSGNYGQIALDEFSLKPLGIIQHLPIVGVG